MNPLFLNLFIGHLIRKRLGQRSLKESKTNILSLHYIKGNKADINVFNTGHVICAVFYLTRMVL